MRRSLVTPSAAHEAALRAAEAGGVDVRDVHDLAQVRAVARLLDEVWGSPEDDPLMAPGMLRALTHAGNYAAAAYVSDAMVGAVTGFLGRDEDGVYLHSHILGVTAEHRGARVGFALKQHQRAWALERGMGKVTWTFDPLVRRNAYFNVQKLGARAGEYLVRFYGSMNDGINAGDETDRLLMVWHLDDPRVDAAAGGGLQEPDVEALLSAGAGVVLTQAGAVDAGAWRDVVLCATPQDAVALRKQDRPAAMSWRVALRDTLGAALSEGYRVTGFARSGWYVLERG